MTHDMTAAELAARLRAAAEQLDGEHRDAVLCAAVRLEAAVHG